MGVNATRDDDWLIDDSPSTGSPVLKDRTPWKILIVDDEPDVHSVTRLALRNIEFHERKLELISAYSASEAYEILSHNPDVAVVLLDVVMETDDAGLRLVQRIRNELQNQLCRIVLRTGQPGQAPEQEVIVSYDINDYKSKTELTTQKLFTTVIASLRSYESLLALENHRDGLNKILRASSNLYKAQSLREFASGLLKQINAVLNIGTEGALCLLHKADTDPEGRLQIIAGTGRYEDLANSDYLDPGIDINGPVQTALRERRHVYDHPNDVLYLPVRSQREFVIFLTPAWPLNPMERSLLEVYCDRISLAFDNLWLHDQLKSSQVATVALFADLTEHAASTPESGLNPGIRSLAEGTTRQLRAMGAYESEITPQFEELIGIACMLHDIGKLRVSQTILGKSGNLEPGEIAEIRQHPSLGGEILTRALKLANGSNLLELAAEIATHHHERFDGKGYPQGTAGQAIPLSARIASVCDVFDALTQVKPYREAWATAKARTYLQEQAGSQFDPVVVNAFVRFLDEQDVSATKS